jgi:hypothetical protein
MDVEHYFGPGQTDLEYFLTRDEMLSVIQGRGRLGNEVRLEGGFTTLALVIATFGRSAFCLEGPAPEMWSYDPECVWLFQGNGLYLFDNEEDAVQMRLMCS